MPIKFSIVPDKSSNLGFHEHEIIKSKQSDKHFKETLEEMSRADPMLATQVDGSCSAIILFED